MNSRENSHLGCLLSDFFADYLPRQRNLSQHTLHSYRDTFKLLLQFIAGPKHDPSQLTLAQLTAERMTAFLQHLEMERHNQATTRNVRLSAIHSFFRYVGRQCPEHLAHAQRILSLPFKRAGTRPIQHLDFDEIQALLRTIDRRTPIGRRDFALLSLMFNTGARVSEIVSLQAADLRLASPASVLFRGKGRKERICPLWSETADLLQGLLQERAVPLDTPAPLFLNHHQSPLTRFGVRLILRKHLQDASRRQPSLRQKRLHPHSLRHSTAVYLLRAGVDISTIAHWLGHASVSTTGKYLSVDMAAKRAALAKAKPLLKKGRPSAKWRTHGNLIAWLESL